MEKKLQKINLISVIVPIYKQEKTITRDLNKINKVLSKLRYPAELICVVDGKDDETFNKAIKLAKKLSNIRYIRR